MGRVVNLRTRSGHPPDFAALARRRLIAARRALDVSAAEFATMLVPLVGYPVSGEAVAAWETDSVPPGDVLVAAGTVTSANLSASGDQYIGGVLSSIPPSFAAEALCGLWVTAFRFGPGPTRKAHVDIAEISLESDRLMRISNHPPTPRSEGRVAPFRNELEAQLVNRHLVGHWRNSNDTRYFGTFHLAVLPGEVIMEGYYTGFGNDIEVSTGPWRWIRLDADSIAGTDLSGVRLRDPVDLGARVEDHSQYDVPLTLADIEEESDATD
jgi:hypothetical protein